MTYATVVAQLEDLKPWFQYGLAGVVIFFLMQKVDTRLGRIEHKLTGLNRTLLIELLSRESLSFQAKKMAEAELEKNGGGTRHPYSE